MKLCQRSIFSYQWIVQSFCSINPQEESQDKEHEIDLEDGEIEDDEDESAVVPPEEVPKPEELPLQNPPFPEKSRPYDKEKEKEKPDKDRDRNRDKDRDRRKHEEKGKRHMTEAEKSILHLRKREEAQRKKWEKMNRIRETDVMGECFTKRSREIRQKKCFFLYTIFSR